MRYGLCCQFNSYPIKFKTTTVTAILKLSRLDALAKISKICLDNAKSLYKALVFCKENNIGCFRVNSQIMPLHVHPIAGYQISELPNNQVIVELFKRCGDFAKKNQIRTTFHPEQLVILNSPHKDVVESSIKELVYQAEVAEWINADVINIHAGGAYGDKKTALDNLIITIESLPENVIKKLTIENDDKIFTPQDLLPVCRAVHVPLVYDIHHHRCNKDLLTEREVTRLALLTWNREPLFHLSSPRDGWEKSNPKPHADYICESDFPKFWLNQPITVEIEAKAKEDAVLKFSKK